MPEKEFVENLRELLISLEFLESDKDDLETMWDVIVELIS